MQKDWQEVERELPARLKQERRRAGLTQVELAVAAGVTARSIKRYEAGESTIPSDVIYKLRAAGLNMRFVLFGQA